VFVDLSGYLAIVRRWWWTLIVAAWIAGLTGWLVASTIPPTYESQAKVLVGPLNTDTDTLRASGLLVQTYAQYVSTREVLASAIQEVGLDLSPAELAESMRVTANDITRILTIRVQAEDPEQAAELANTIATELEQLTSSGLSRPEGLIQIIEFAEPSLAPVAPQVSLIVMLAAFAGIVVAVVVILLLEYFGDTIRTGRELAALAGAPFLGAVQAPSGDKPGTGDLLVLDNPASRAAQPYRLIATKLALGPDRDVRSSVLVLDSDSEAEAAVVATNLAAALGRGGRRTALIDGSGPGGTVTRLLGWTEREGLSETLAQGLHPELPDVMGGSLAGLPSGREPLDGVDPDDLRAVIAGLTAEDGTAIVVGGPISTSPVSLALARAVDSVVLVARRDRARREDVTLTTEALRLIGIAPVGVILTERPSILGLRRESRRGTGARVMPIDVRLPAAKPTIVTRATSSSRRTSSQAADPDPA
jgi:capsular polysaccharide biosynthesis protein/Mrp family chromosome partitioning ATPase